MQAATPETVAEAAGELDDSCPPLEQKEETSDYLWLVWEIILDIARSSGVTNGIHKNLISILESLRQIAKGDLHVWGVTIKQAACVERLASVSYVHGCVLQRCLIVLKILIFRICSQQPRRKAWSRTLSSQSRFYQIVSPSWMSDKPEKGQTRPDLLVTKTRRPAKKATLHIDRQSNTKIEHALNDHEKDYIQHEGLRIPHGNIPVSHDPRAHLSGEEWHDSNPSTVTCVPIED
ncbi:hypothetical protein B7463_g11119, partial [Scytalidium lignicola]